jgi:hypothetical protein
MTVALERWADHVAHVVVGKPADGLPFRIGR